MMRRLLDVTGIAVAALAVTGAPAQADMEFWLDNQSSVEIRALVQEIPGVHYLSAGQKNNTIAQGGWFSSVGCGGTCLRSPYHVRFKHISEERTYCVWEVVYSVRESTGSAWGSVSVEVRLWDQADGMLCSSAGQRSAMWHSSAQSEGVYLTFTIDN